MSSLPYCTRNTTRLTAWKTNAYADEEQPPRHCWKGRPLVRGTALGCWRVHGALLHLPLLEYIGVKLSLQLSASGSICCWSSDKCSSFFFNQVLSVFLQHHNHGVTAKSLSELPQRRAQHLAWTSPPVSSFPHQSPVGNEEAGPLSLHSLPLHTPV